VGVESTVLDLSGPAVLLRSGGVTVEAIESVIWPVGRGISPAEANASRALRSPGLVVSHYAPSLPVRVDARAVDKNEALLAFGDPLPGAGAVFNLSPSGDLSEAAANLFAGLRTLDAEGARLGLVRIAAMTVPERGLGLAINDRLQRAAAPRH
jgi:L-threonylcarbamoyladenylate synthase